MAWFLAQVLTVCVNFFKDGYITLPYNIFKSSNNIKENIINVIVLGLADS